jgi:hypothetical protein
MVAYCGYGEICGSDDDIGTCYVNAQVSHNMSPPGTATSVTAACVQIFALRMTTWSWHDMLLLCCSRTLSFWLVRAGMLEDFGRDSQHLR